MKNKILVTGAAGFIGYNFVRKYHNELDIIALDSLTYAANKDAVNFFKENSIDFLEMDILDVTSNIIKDKDINAIINFAAETHVDNSIENPDVFVKTNINGTLNLLNITRELNLRYHQISTDEVYGELDFNNLEEKFTTETPIDPSSPYSASKASADLLVQAYVRTYGIKATISRCSNNYGIFQNKEKLIPKIISNFSIGKPIGIYGNGKNIRDWIHVDDHNSAVFMIMKKRDNGVYNIGSNNEKTNNEIANLIVEKMGLSNDLIEYIEDRKGHDLRYAIDSESMDELGWAPEIDFDEGLNQVIEFYNK